MKPLVLLLSAFLVVTAASGEPFAVIVRHAEKAPAAGNDPDLSPAGRTRADALARMLKDSAVTAIFTSEFKRTQETAAPLAKVTGVTPTILPAKDTVALIAKLHQLNENALVVGHGDTIPNIAKGLGIDAPIQIRDDDYSELFVVTLSHKPQLLRLHFP